jgi:hypothetical protein
VAFHRDGPPFSMAASWCGRCMPGIGVAPIPA